MWYQKSVKQNEWRLGYAEMLPTPYDWRAVFEAERGILVKFFAVLLFFCFIIQNYSTA